MARLNDILTIFIYDSLDRFIIWIALGPKFALETLLYGKHLDVMDAMPPMRLRLSARRQSEVLVFGDIGRDIRSERHGKIATLSTIEKAHNHYAGPTMLEHELTIFRPACLDETIRYGHYPQSSFPSYATAGPVETSPAEQVNDILRSRTPSFAEVIRTREPNSLKPRLATNVL